jgi:glucokinase
VKKSPVLVADIGGTNARFALAHVSDEQIALSDVARFRGGDFATFEDALAAYLDTCPQKPTRACFAVAGPVEAGAVKLTNSRWQVAAAPLARRFGFTDVRLVNDFAGQAAGAPLIDATRLIEIAPGRLAADAPRVVLGPGTGLGLALLAPSPLGFSVIATEGGHIPFAPQSQAARDLHARHAARGRYVSFEDICSGTGLTETYSALAGACADVSASEVFARTAGDPVAQTAVALFFEALATFAATAVLASGGLGGVYLCGGILPQHKAELAASDFVRLFRTFGPNTAYLTRTPIWLVDDPDVALLGAAFLARQAVR